EKRGRAAVDLVEIVPGFGVEKWYGPSAALEAATAILVRSAQPLHHAVHRDIGRGRQLHVAVTSSCARRVPHKARIASRRRGVLSEATCAAASATGHQDPNPQVLCVVLCRYVEPGSGGKPSADQLTLFARVESTRATNPGGAYSGVAAPLPTRAARFRMAGPKFVIRDVNAAAISGSPTRSTAPLAGFRRQLSDHLARSDSAVRAYCPDMAA